MKFSEYPYRRPDMEALKANMKAQFERFEKAESVKEQQEVIKRIEDLISGFVTQATICSIRHTIDTKDEFYKEENDFYDENMPLFSELESQYKELLLGSRFREELEEIYGEQIFRLAEINKKAFTPEIIPELVEEGKLSTQYDQLLASAQIEFDGKTLTLAQIDPYMQSPDRAVRKAAMEAKFGFFAEHEAELDEIYDKMVKVRDKMAKKMGFENYVEMGYARMNRTDYDADMVANYRKQVAEELVDIAVDLRKRQQERLGLDHLYFYDEAFAFESGNPVPQGEPDWILEQADKMYEELSPETREFFRFMRENELMDVLAKKGKSGGGYMTMIPDYRAPFIFANFNGTKHDVEVMTHEAGHAFQGYMSREQPLLEYFGPTLEACEIHSMSMEFLTWPWMELFFKHQTEKFKFSHLAGAVEFIPYGVAVDEFQHFVYENPEATPEERKNFWHEMERKYLPDRDYGDFDYLNRGGFWMRQSHIFGAPFYYIDYTLAQVCAFQFWIKSREDREEAWQDYLRLCALGGSKSFLELVEAANLRNPFEDGCIASVIPEIREYLDSVDDKKL